MENRWLDRRYRGIAADKSHWEVTEKKRVIYQWIHHIHQLIGMFR